MHPDLSFPGKLKRLQIRQVPLLRPEVFLFYSLQRSCPVTARRQIPYSLYSFSRYAGSSAALIIRSGCFLSFKSRISRL